MAFGDRPTKNNVLYREDGTPWLVNVSGVQHAGNVKEAISLSLIPGAITGNSFGYIATSAVTILPLRGSQFVEPADNLSIAREVVSGSANDSNSVGTGARKIRITYYDVNMNGPFTADINMNGTAAVATPAMRFVEKMVVLEAGSTGANVGAITLRVVTGAVTIGVINASEGVTHWAHHYVQPNKYCILDRVTLSSSAVATQIFVRKARPLTANSFEEQITESFRTPIGGATVTIPMWLCIPGPARITMYVRPDAITASTIYGSLGFYELVG